MSENRIDKLIDINLKLIFNNSSKEEYYTHFINEKGNQIDNLDIDPKIIATEMEENGLIWLNVENCKLKSFGEKVCKDEGWLRHLKSENDRIMKKKEESKSIVNNTVNIQGDNEGNVNQSYSKDFNSPTTQNAVHKTEKKANNKSWIEKTAWVVGISAGLIAIYEFIIKRFL